MMTSFPQRLAMRDTRSRRTGSGRTGSGLLLIGLLVGIAGGCTPTVKLATDEPITINLNVNIRHEILIKVERELDDLFAKESELF